MPGVEQHEGEDHRMSYSWSFHSFSDETFRNVFGRSSPEQVGKFLGLAASFMGELNPEFAYASRLALASGISYDGLSPNASRAVDEVIRFAFSPEGLESELEVEHVSPDGLHPSVIVELVRRLDAPAPLSAGLLRGRRFGQTGPADCEYCIFGSDEVSAVLRETRDACAGGGPWSAAYLPELLQECLVEPFEAAERAGRPIFCRLS